MWAPRASASTSSGWAYSRSIRSRTRRSRARSRRFAAAGLLVTWVIVPRRASELHRTAERFGRGPRAAEVVIGVGSGSTRRPDPTDRRLLPAARRRLQLVDALRRLGLRQAPEVLGQFLTGLLRERLQVRALRAGDRLVAGGPVLRVLRGRRA